jgi:hypothetical protein
VEFDVAVAADLVVVGRVEAAAGRRRLFGAGRASWFIAAS